MPNNKNQTRAKGLLLLLVILSIFWGYMGSRLTFNYNFESFFPQGDPATQFFEAYRKRFETDNDFVLVALENKSGVFDSTFLSQVKAVTEDLKQLDYVEFVVSPLEIKEVKRDPGIGGFFETPYLRYQQPETYAIDSARIFDSPLLEGVYFSSDATTVALFVKTSEYLSKEACDELAAGVQACLAAYTFDEVHVAGRSVGQVYYVDLMQRELVLFMGLSFLLIIVFLFLAFRTLWGIWVPVVVVLLTIVWTLGFMKLMGQQIDLMLTVLPTIMFVVGMSDVVHILSRYYEELRKGKEKMEALKVTVREVGLATALTSLTTAIGFLTLLTSTIGPIRSFGIYTAVGVFIAYLLAFTLLPAILVLSPKPKQIRVKSYWYDVLHFSFRWTLNNKRLVVVALASCMLVGLVGMSRIDLNNFLLEDLKEGDFMKEEFAFFEKKFAGVRPFELSIQTKQAGDNLLNLERLKQLDSLQCYLEDEYEVGNLVSVVFFLKTANMIYAGGDPSRFELPRTQKRVDRFVRLVQKRDTSGLWEKYTHSTDGVEGVQELRVVGRIKDYGSAALAQKDEALEHFLHQLDPAGELTFTQTGTAVLIDKNNRYLAKDMVIGLLIAFGIIAVIVGLMFKSWRMVLISLVPNVLPLVMVAGVMGFSGIDLKVSTSIIFTIAFGIAVDDTIHFLSKFRMEISKGKTTAMALKNTYLYTGKAIVVTTLILSGGFLILLFSGFLGTFYIGLLIGITLLFAVLADLLLLPLLLVWFYKR